MSEMLMRKFVCVYMCVCARACVWVRNEHSNRLEALETIADDDTAQSVSRILA
jgi:hypothetical protein